MESITTAGGLDLMAATNMSWVRKNAVKWSSIETTEGIYTWSGMGNLDNELKNASSNGIKVILVVRSTPQWARKIAGTGPSCGPIAQNKLSAFGNFMHALVARYSVAPYNVKYWELWNEEDGIYKTGDAIWGCWGDADDTNYFGGGYYAEMLKVAYPQIKAADTQAQVLIGGLTLGCDPRPGAGCSITGGNSTAPKFLEGIVQNGGGPYFDGVSYHSYDFYDYVIWGGTLGQYGNGDWQSAWNTTGPTFIAKAEFIKSVLSNYNVTGKYLVNSEVALACGDADGNSPGDYCKSTDFEKTKAYYVAQTYAAAIAEGLHASIWYSVFGWRNSQLINSTDLSTTQAYTAFKFGQSELNNVAYSGQVVSADIGGTSGVSGYKFLRNDRRVWMIWSLDGNTHSITFSSGVPLAAWDALGVTITPATSMSITIKPLYLEWNP